MSNNENLEVLHPNGLVSWARVHHMISVILEEGVESDGSSVNIMKQHFAEINVDEEGFLFQLFLQHMSIKLTNDFEKGHLGHKLSTKELTKQVWNFMINYFMSNQ